MKLGPGKPTLPLTKETLAAVAFRTLEVTGSVFLNAGQEKVEAFIQGLADARKLPARSDGRPHWCKMVMDVADKACAEAFRAELCERGLGPKPDFFADVAQTVQFGSVAHHIPTVIRNSRIYSFAGERLLLPDELLAVQGVPVATNGSDADCVPDSVLQVPDAHSFREVVQRLGNSMHLCQVGSCVLIALLDAALA